MARAPLEVFGRECRRALRVKVRDTGQLGPMALVSHGSNPRKVDLLSLALASDRVEALEWTCQLVRRERAAFAGYGGIMAGRDGYGIVVVSDAGMETWLADFDPRTGLAGWQSGGFVEQVDGTFKRLQAAVREAVD